MILFLKGSFLVEKICRERINSLPVVTRLERAELSLVAASDVRAHALILCVIRGLMIAWDGLGIA